MWKNLSKEELDRAYNNSLAVKNSADIIRSWEKASAQAKLEINGACDIPYGDSRFQLFDFFSAKEDSPVIIFVHGGFWQMRSKNDFTFIVPPLVNAGFDVAMLGYSLAPHASLNQIVMDVRNGIHAIQTYLTKQYTSPKKIWLLGWSAGAHLISMALGEDGVMGGTAVSGIYDVEPMMHCYINDKLQLDETTVINNSPIRLAPPLKSLDIFVGQEELPEMQRQSIDFFEYRKSKGVMGIFENIPQRNHYTIFDELTSTTGVILTSIKARLLRSM